MKKIILVVFFVTPLISFSQNTLEFTVGVGYTGIDVEGLVEKDEISGTVAQDWDQFSYGISAQFYFTQFGNIQFGTELMYHYLYWYQVRVPFGSQPITREYYVDVVRITPIFRFGGDGNFNFDVGPELNFADGVVFGILLSANYNIAISESIGVPVKVRLDVLTDTVITVPITLNAGIRYSF